MRYLKKKMKICSIRRTVAATDNNISSRTKTDFNPLNKEVRFLKTCYGSCVAILRSQIPFFIQKL